MYKFSFHIYSQVLCFICVNFEAVGSHTKMAGRGGGWGGFLKELSGSMHEVSRLSNGV